eukprot:m.58773 g.58773  ORF g.58773 m.58773 type:complete len:132 (+) comp13790_c0_seq1:715-1110(+)
MHDVYCVVAILLATCSDRVLLPQKRDHDHASLLDQVQSTRAFLGASVMGSALTIDALEDHLQLLHATACSSVELMVHPGYPCNRGDSGCGAGPDDFAQSSDRAYETSVLTAIEWSDVLARYRVRLISWNDL